jgi:hypothetical protein
MAAHVQVGFDSADPGRQAAFWTEALHYRIPDPPGVEGIPEEHRNDRASTVDPEGVEPRLYFQRVPEGNEFCLQ